MTSFRNAAFAALLLTGAAMQPAHAMTVAALAGLPAAGVAKAVFSFAERCSRPPVGVSTASTSLRPKRRRRDYFDFDALITLGASRWPAGRWVGLAVGAARRRAEEDAKREPQWRASVFRAVQAELAEFTAEYRRAA